MKFTLIGFVFIVATVTLFCPTAAKAANGPIEVFILCGQSNMVGHGKVEMGRNPHYNPKDPKSQKYIRGGLGSLRAMVNDNPKKFGPNGTTPLVDANGKWLVRKDVKIYAYRDGHTSKGGLTVGFGAPGSRWIGPEYGFGQVVGNALKADVLLIKVSTGGTSLAKDWRPPSAVAQRGGKVGPCYTRMAKTVTKVLANLGKYFPSYAGRKVVIAGFGWHQGWNDAVNSQYSDEYQKNLVDLIDDVRAQFHKPKLPFVIATTSMYKPRPSRTKVEQAQFAVANPQKYPQFKGNVFTVDTRPFWRSPSVSPSNFGYHWNHNGITHYDIGAAMGKAMLKLMKKSASN